MARISRNTSSLLLFVFQPVVGFLSSLNNIDSKVGKFIFITFSTLWGYSQSFTYTPADGYRIGAGFCQYPIDDFTVFIKMFTEGNAIDGYLLITNYLIHLFTDNVKVYFALLGFIYGLLCYYTVVSLIKERENERSSFLNLILFLLFATASFANMSMPRFWTAAWFAALVFLKITQGKKQWAWLVFLLPFIHFSFVPIAIGLLVIGVLSNLLDTVSPLLFWTMCLFFIFSFIIPETTIARFIPQEMLDDNSRLTSKMGYISETINQNAILEESSAYRKANNIVTSLFQLLMKLGSFVLLVHMYLRRNILNKNAKTNFTFNTVLLMAIITYFMSIIPSTGWRFINILWMLLFILLFRYYDVFRPKSFGKTIISLYVINIYTISFMFYVTYRTVDLLLFYMPLPFVIMHGIGFPPVYFV